MIPQRMYIVPMTGADVRFLGGSLRARQARVAARAGATFADPASLVSTDASVAVITPSDVALMRPLFLDPAFVEATADPRPTRLVSPDQACVYVGAASQVLPLANDRAALDRLPSRTLAAGALLYVGTHSARRRATRAALLATGKATDGFVSRTFNRPISRACSRAALAVGLSATGASLLTLLVGLLCAWVAAQPGFLPFVVTGALFQLASVLDGVDGEIARATLTESETGARVDTVVDQVTYLACFAGATVGWVREGSGTLALWSTVAIGAALLLTLWRGGRFVARHADNASFVFIDRAVRRAAKDTGLPMLALAAHTFTLLRRDVFAVIFFQVSLSGQRASVPALILFGTLVANLTFSFYARELADAARAERGLVNAATPGATA